MRFQFFSLLVSLLLLGAGGETFGQTLTGEVDLYRAEVDLVGFRDSTGALSPGNPGLNQTYDFSTAIASSNRQTRYVSPDSLSNAAMFPNSNLGYSESITENYLISNDDSTAIYGEITEIFGSGLRVKYTSARPLVYYPLAFGDTRSRRFTGTVESVFFGSPISTSIRSGSAVIELDGAGSLVLPMATYPDIVRVKTLEAYTDSAIDFPTVSQTTVERYQYFIPSYDHPVASWTRTTTVGSGGSDTTEATVFSWVAPSFISANDAAVFDADRLRVYAATPGTLTVDLSLDRAATLRFAVSDLRGRNVLRTEAVRLSPGFRTRRLGLPSLAPGLYLLRLEVDGQAIARKFVVR